MNFKNKSAKVFSTNLCLFFRKSLCIWTLCYVIESACTQTCTLNLPKCLYANFSLSPSLKVLKSMWVVLADNLSLALSLLYSVLGLLLSGGTALINAVGLGAKLAALLQGLTLCIRSCS